MEISHRIAEQIDKLPPAMKQLLDAEFAAGNEIYSIEFGRGEDKGKVALILNHPFRTKASDAPATVKYREMKDQDPEVFEFYQDGGLFSLVTAKFKPMKLAKLSPGPVSPNEAHEKFMKQYAKEQEALAKKREAAAKREEKTRAKITKSAAKRQDQADAFVPPPRASMSEEANKFLASMNLTYDQWHDGIGYDLDAMQQIPEAELEAIESILIHHSPRDWRDIEALACIDSPKARKVVEEAAESTDAKVRREARHHVPDKVDAKKREKLLIKSLENDVIYGGLSESIDEVEEFHPPGVIDALFRGALKRDGEAAVHFAALLFFLHGKAKEPFDWDHRPFFLKFHSTGDERVAVFKELCKTVGVDPKKYL